MGKLILEFKKNFYNILLVLIIILILSPFLFSNGYFFGIDFIYGPEIFPVDGQFYPNYLFWIKLQLVLSYILPGFIVQKLIFISFFILSVYSIRKFLYLYFNNKSTIFILTIFFICNPFVYTRLIQGQVYILLAYSLFPLLYYFYKNNSILKYSLITAIILSLSPHFIFIIGIFSLFLFLSSPINIKLRTFFYSLIIIVLLNSYWLFNIYNYTNISNFQINDIYSFQSHAVYFNNIYLEIFGLNGFWGDSESRYLINKNNFNYIYLFFLIIGSIIGFFISFKKEKNISIFFLIILIFGFILSIGVSSNNIFKELNLFLFQNIPFYIGLRESNKFSILLVISYIYFLGFLIDHLNIIFKDKMITFSLFILVFINGPVLSQVFGGQLKGIDYPYDWYEIKSYLNKYNNSNNDCIYKNNKYFTKCYDYISFPWHQSLGFKFLNKIVINPVGVFFGNNILVPDNIEIRNIYSQSNRPESKIIEKYIGPSGIFKGEYTKSDMSNFIYDLNGLGIKRIILLKEVDYKLYDDILQKLQENKFIELEKSNSMIKLFKVIKY